MSRILYDNYNINYTEWFEEFKDYCECNDIDHTQYDEDSEFFHNWIYDTLSMDWDDLMCNIKYDKDNNVDCVVTGRVGRWNGNFDIEPKHFSTLRDALNACIRDCDYIIITENEGVINIKGIHHDASNYFEIHKLNDKGYDAYWGGEYLNNEGFFDKFNFGF